MAHGLVDWREWGPEAFAEAQEKDRIILLDISAVWCHWCHVMDSTSYSDPEVAGVINSSFIPVRVDTDRMPDVNERYNMGGWPTTAFLTPTGEVLVGATYVPPDKLRDTIHSLLSFYRDHRAELDVRIAELKAEKLRHLHESSKAKPGEPTEDVSAFVLEQLEANYDSLHGGFGEAPKFPVPDILELLLTSAASGNAKHLNMAAKTMQGMAGYGMYDQVMGGFFRYSVTADWSVPHFEKMTESNSGLIAAYADAYRLTGEDSFLDTVRKTTDYVDEWLWDERGFFRGSQDADEVYYTLPLEERMKREHPFVDGTVYTNLNAMMAQGYLSAWEATGDEELKGRALTSLYFITSNMKSETGGYYHYHDGKPRRSGLLTDQAAMLRALVHAYQLTSNMRWLDEAVALAGFMERELWDKDGHAFFDAPYDPDALAALAYRSKPFIDNADAALGLVALAELTGNEHYRELARGCLGAHLSNYAEYGYMAADYALAVESLIKPAVHVTLVGRRDSDEMAGLMRSALSRFVPRRVLRVLDVDADADEVAASGYVADGPASAYICVGTTCTARIDDPDKLAAELERVRAAE